MCASKSAALLSAECTGSCTGQAQALLLDCRTQRARAALCASTTSTASLWASAAYAARSCTCPFTFCTFHTSRLGQQSLCTCRHPSGSTCPVSARPTSSWRVTAPLSYNGRHIICHRLLTFSCAVCRRREGPGRCAIGTCSCSAGSAGVCAEAVHKLHTAADSHAAAGSHR